MNNEIAETGARILQTRKERGLTRERLAEMADISVQFLADIERGAKSMTVSTLRKLCFALNVTTDSIVNGVAPASPEGEAAWLDLYRSLPEGDRPFATDLVRIFAKAGQGRQ